MIIRKARPEDASVLAKIVEDSTRHGGYPEDWINHTRPDTSDFVSDVYVAEDENELKGFYRSSGKQSRPDELWVSPAHFGSGVGKELFLHAMETGSKSGRG